MPQRRLMNLLISAFIVIFHCNLFAMDTIKTKHQHITDIKTVFKFELLRRALELTQDEFGPYKHEVANLEVSAGNTLKASMDRGIINTLLVPSTEFWDKNAIAIRVPVRLGLLSYRVLMIKKENLDKFSQVKDLTQLNTFTAGLISGWATTEIYRNNNLHFVESSHFDGIFSMLNKQRFDYMPRGIYEVYNELSLLGPLADEIIIEPSLALYIPTSSYVYVSKSEPRLANRLSKGLRQLLDSGELKSILFRYFKADIDRAKLEQRRYINIESDYHNKYSKQDEQYYLFNHLIEK